MNRLVVLVFYQVRVFELQVMAVGTFEWHTVLNCARYNRAVDYIETFSFGILIMYHLKDTVAVAKTSDS